METGDRRSNLRGSVSGCSRSRVRLARVGAVGSLRGVGGRSNRRRRRRRQRAADRARRGGRRGHRIDRDWSTRDAGRRARVCRRRSRGLGRVVRLAGGRLRDIGSEHVCGPARDDVHSRGARRAVSPSSGRLSAQSRVRPRPDLPISRPVVLYRRPRWQPERGAGNMRAPRSSGNHAEWDCRLGLTTLSSPSSRTLSHFPCWLDAGRGANCAAGGR
jgi:hypothetical protein